VLISELATRDAIPKKFLESILLELRRRGLVESKKGKGGGYFLRRRPEDITFSDVIRALDGPLAAVPCVSQTAYMKCVECVDEETCGVRFAMKEVRDATARILDGTTLADISRQVARKARRARTASAGTPQRRSFRNGRSTGEERSEGLHQCAAHLAVVGRIHAQQQQRRSGWRVIDSFSRPSGLGLVAAPFARPAR
jgi:Rrf2 family protein